MAVVHLVFVLALQPSNAELLYNDIDKGVSVPTDVWLDLAGHVTKGLRGEEKITKNIPTPNLLRRLQHPASPPP
jgi:hypothetical protein